MCIKGTLINGSCLSFGNQRKIRMGYCPQMDALDELLTVKETLDIYTRLRGLPSKLWNKVCTVEDKILRETPISLHKLSRAGYDYHLIRGFVFLY